MITLVIAIVIAIAHVAINEVFLVHGWRRSSSNSSLYSLCGVYQTAIGSYL